MEKEEKVKKVISVKELYKLYRVGDSIVRALDGVSFEVCEGEFCAIVGTSGSGKVHSPKYACGVGTADERRDRYWRAAYREAERG